METARQRIPVRVATSSRAWRRAAKAPAIGRAQPRVAAVEGVPPPPIAYSVASGGRQVAFQGVEDEVEFDVAVPRDAGEGVQGRVVVFGEGCPIAQEVAHHHDAMVASGQSKQGWDHAPPCVAGHRGVDGLLAILGTRRLS